MTRSIEVGDWVAFYVNARITYGKVEYVTDGASWERGYRVQTTAGTVNSESILETRKVGCAEVSSEAERVGDSRAQRQETEGNGG